LKNKIIGISVSLLLLTSISIAEIPNNTRRQSDAITSQKILASSDWSQIQKLLASDGSNYDSFGNSVSIDKNSILVGSYNDENGTGSAYVFIRSGATWSLEAKLVASDGSKGDLFSVSVSIYNDTAVIGALYDDDNGIDSGSAYVFTRNGTTWTQQQKLLASDGSAGDQFGRSVSLFKDSVLIAADCNDDYGEYTGSAYVFIRNGATWTQQQKLLALDPIENGSFGVTVSLSGDTALIGANGFENGIDSGSAYVFTRNGTTWTQQQKLIASDGAPGDSFCSASLSGDTALIGAFGDDDNGDFSGSAYIFTRNGTTWTQQQKLLASDGAMNDFFGMFVCLNNDTAIIGAERDTNENGYYAGSAYIFARSESIWTQQQKLLASDGESSDSFGYSVSLDGNIAVVGARFDNDNGYDSGSVYVFKGQNQPPIANFTYVVDDLSVVFDASSSLDPDGEILDWYWTFGDEVSGLGETFKHDYHKSGTYNVTLTVVDDNSKEDVMTKEITVESYKKAIIFGRIDNLTTVSDKISFKAINTRIITFAPFSWIPYSNEEIITIAKGYSGFIGYRYVFALCRMLI
jgi:hypothetical protein